LLVIIQGPCGLHLGMGLVGNAQLNAVVRRDLQAKEILGRNQQTGFG
jgi:hypothetical protein